MLAFNLAGKGLELLRTTGFADPGSALRFHSDQCQIAAGLAFHGVEHVEGMCTREAANEAHLRWIQCAALAYGKGSPEHKRALVGCDMTPCADMPTTHKFIHE